MTLEFKTFGSYRLLELLGEGASGSVWKALDLRLERKVALKLLKHVDAVRHRAMMAEAKLACRLNHPHVATIYEAGEVDGVPYIAMELVEGRNLHSYCDTPAEASWLRSVALQAASALHHAHQMGVIHRDVKPDNMVLRPDGALKVLDFGIARAGGEPRPTDDHTPDDTQIDVTATGHCQGTPAFMSPEQVHGQALTASTDQFSLGVALYTLAVGQHPFRRENLLDTLIAVSKEPAPPLLERRPDLPVNLAATIDRMMAKAPAQRFANLGDVVVALSEDQATLEMPARRPSKRRASWPWVAGLVVALGGITAVGWRWYHASRGEETARRLVIAVLPMELRGGAEPQRWMAVSLADAMSVALASRPDVAVVERVQVVDALRRNGESPGQPLQKPGEMLKVLQADWIIQGTLRVEGERLRVQLVALDGRQSHAPLQLDGQTQALLDLEDQLQRRLPKLLGLNPEPGSPVARAKQARTRELYAKGNETLTEGNQDALNLAVSYFQEALQLEPDYAPAHAALAWAEMELGASIALNQGRYPEAEQRFHEAKSHAEKAIALDPRTPQAHRSLAAILLRLKDYEGARQAAMHAVRQNPQDAQATAVLADIFQSMDGDENVATARRYFEKALALQPEAWWTHHRYAVLLQNSGDLEAALTHARQAMALRPQGELVYLTATDVLFWMGRTEEAESVLRAGLTQVPGSALLRLLQVYAGFLKNRKEEARALAVALGQAFREGSSNARLLEGLDAWTRGDAARTVRIYRDFEAQVKAQRREALGHNERRAASVNLYFMASVVMNLGEKALARELLARSEDLHPGKRRVALQDPRFKGLLDQK